MKSGCLLWTMKSLAFLEVLETSYRCAYAVTSHNHTKSCIFIKTILTSNLSPFITRGSFMGDLWEDHRMRSGRPCRQLLGSLWHLLEKYLGCSDAPSRLLRVVLRVFLWHLGNDLRFQDRLGALNHAYQLETKCYEEAYKLEMKSPC